MALPILPLAIAGGAAALGYLGSREARGTSLRVAREQMQFQERMSSTAYQRAMEDMRAAGLNPMLAYQQGGASTPGGAMPRVSDMVAPAVSSAMAARRLSSEVRNMEALARQNSEIARRERYNADLARETFYWNVGRAQHESFYWNMQAIRAQKDAIIRELEIPSARALAEAWEAIGAKGAGARLIIPLLRGLK